MQEIIIYFSAGFLTGLIIMFFVVNNLKKQQSLLKKKYEKTSLGADDSELKVKTLENKIKTLEAALEKTLKNQWVAVGIKPVFSFPKYYIKKDR